MILTARSIEARKRAAEKAAGQIEASIGERVSHWPFQIDKEPRTWWHYRLLSNGRRMVAKVGRKNVDVWPEIFV